MMTLHLRVKYTVCIIIIIHDALYLYTFHNLSAIEVRDDLHAFAQKPNAVDCGYRGTHNNTIYIALLLLSPRSYARDIYGISRFTDAIPTMYYIIVFCCAVMISLAIHPCRYCGTYLYNMLIDFIIIMGIRNARLHVFDL